MDYDEALSDSAFNVNLRRYKTVNMILIQETYVVWKRKMDLHEAGGVLRTTSRPTLNILLLLRGVY